MRVVVIGHTYVVGENRGKLACLAKHPDVELTLLSPEFWIDADLGLQEFSPEKRFDSRLLPIRGAGNIRRYFYSLLPLVSQIRKIRPQIIHLESEANSLSGIQLALLKWTFPYRLVLFVWDNIIATRFRHLRAARWVYGKTDHLIAGSNEALSVARAQGFKGKGSVLPQIGIDPIDLKKIEKRDPWKKQKKFRVN
jgi:hypothetical protein